MGDEKKIIFLGPPGAGKGTQAKELATLLDIPHISTGEILRGAIEAKTELGKQAQNYMAKGELVPDSLIRELIKDRLQQPDAQKGWILDGFPRNLDQAQFFDELLKKLNQSCDFVLYLEVEDDELVKRMLARGREDDNESTIRNRLKVYLEQTAPVIGFYKEQNLLYPVNGELPIEEVTKSLQEIVNSK